MTVEDANGGRVGVLVLADRVPAAMAKALIGVPGREGARLRGLSATETGELRSWGVLGSGGGLTSRGVALRAILDRRMLDDAFGAL